MQLNLYRQEFYADCTIGKLYHGDTWICDIIEDYDRSLKQTDELAYILYKKVPGKTCIPYGRYEIDITESKHFKRPLPLLKNVIGYEGIRIHSGNDATQSEGCLLTGEQINKNAHALAYSRINFEKVFKLIGDALVNEEVWITIEKYGK
jgi:Steigviridae/Suoliviridae L,D-carboxypeptidase/transpeptidase